MDKVRVSLTPFTSFFEIEEEEKPTPTFKAIGESTSSLLECLIRLEHNTRNFTAQLKEKDEIKIDLRTDDLRHILFP